MQQRYIAALESSASVALGGAIRAAAHQVHPTSNTGKMATTNVSNLQAVGANEKMASLDPKEYQYSAPTAQQQQQMYQQFVQMAFFCFSQMQMQNAMCQGASGQMPFPGTFMPGFPMPGFPNPAFCGMPPLPPGEI